jgi:hypothetical protein
MMIRRARLLSLATFGLVGVLTGCQTWMGGMTLPSPHYLEGHPPQYFPEEAAGLLNPRDRAGVRNPPPVPGVAPPPPVGGAPIGAPPK